MWGVCVLMKLPSCTQRSSSWCAGRRGGLSPPLRSQVDRGCVRRVFRGAPRREMGPSEASRKAELCLESRLLNASDFRPLCLIGFFYSL